MVWDAETRIAEKLLSPCVPYPMIRRRRRRHSANVTTFYVSRQGREGVRAGRIREKGGREEDNVPLA